MSNKTTFITNKGSSFNLKVYRSLALLVESEQDMKSETTLQDIKRAKVTKQSFPSVNIKLRQVISVGYEKRTKPPPPPPPLPIASLILLFCSSGILFLFSSSPGAKNRLMAWSLDRMSGIILIIKDTSAEARKIRINKISTFSFPLP